MSQSKAREHRRELTKEEEAMQNAQAEAKTVYELKVSCLDNGEVQVTSNVDKVLDDPLLYLSVMHDANTAVIKRWKTIRVNIHKKFAAGSPGAPGIDPTKH